MSSENNLSNSYGPWAIRASNTPDPYAKFLLLHIAYVSFFRAIGTGDRYQDFDVKMSEEKLKEIHKYLPEKSNYKKYSLDLENYLSKLPPVVYGDIFGIKKRIIFNKKDLGTHLFFIIKMRNSLIHSGGVDIPGFHLLLKKTNNLMEAFFSEICYYYKQ